MNFLGKSSLNFSYQPFNSLFVLYFIKNFFKVNSLNLWSLKIKFYCVLFWCDSPQKLTVILHHESLTWLFASTTFICFTCHHFQLITNYKHFQQKLTQRSKIDTSSLCCLDFSLFRVFVFVSFYALRFSSFSFRLSDETKSDEHTSKQRDPINFFIHECCVRRLWRYLSHGAWQNLRLFSCLSLCDTFMTIA